LGLEASSTLMARHAFSVSLDSVLYGVDSRLLQKMALQNVSNKCIVALRELWKLGLESCPTSSWIEYIQRNPVSNSEVSINGPIPRFMAKCIVTAINEGMDLSLYHMREILCYELFLTENNDMILDISNKSLSAFLLAYQPMRALSFASQVLLGSKMW
jgi:hypothetical protein